ncbi:MAG: HlyD family efflux transporter periplasmic adaptor subunit [Deltaproteobacteria bacterium]|nr:HlyD family efflux transporter periplasmic adaptor subunit [Deltaproteobacteria bacterium]
MNATNRRRLLVGVPLLIIVIVTVGLAVKRVQDRSEDRSAFRVEGSESMGVRCVRASLGPIQALVFGEGTARAVRREFLTFEHPGRVTYVKTKGDGTPIAEGDPVRGPREGERLGELLASVDKRQHVEELKVAGAGLAEARQTVEVARAQIAEAEAQKRLAEENVRKKEYLHGQKAVSAHELDVARTELKTAESSVRSAQARLESAQSSVAAAEARINQARLPMEQSSIHAPFDGVITFMNIRQGDYFAANLVDMSSEEALLRTIPMVVIDPTRFEVTMELPFFDGMLVRPGQPALVMTAPGLAPISGDLGDGPSREEVVPGTVFSVNPAVSPGGRSIQVKVRTEGGSPGLRDGMFVTAWIVVEEKLEAVMVPFDVFIYRQNKPSVFRVDEARGVVERVDVVEGISGLIAQEVTTGIEAGDLLVTDGRHRLTHGAPVEIVEIVGETGP